MGHMLDTVERQFSLLVQRPVCPQLSRFVVDALLPLFSEADILRYEETLSLFVSMHRDKLDEIFSDYELDDRNPFLSEPVCLLIFERLETDRFMLADLWSRHLSSQFLISLSEIWGVPVSA